MKESISQKIAIFHNLPGGGSTRVLKEIYIHFSNKYIVDVYTYDENQNLWRNIIFPYKQKVIKIYPWKGFIKRLIWIIFILPFIHMKLANKINKKNYKTIIVNHDYFTKSPYLLRYLSKKKIYILQEPQREYYEPAKYHAPHLKNKLANIIRYPIKVIDIYNTKKADVIIANSIYSVKTISKIYRRKPILMYPGVNVDFFKPNRNIKKEKILLSIGAIKPIKGHDFIIRSLHRILGKYQLIIVGDGKDKYIKELYSIAGNKKKFVKIIDKHITDVELVSLYQKSLILCTAAYKEPLGLISLEAQSCGTPVVAINEGGIQETIIDGVTGYLSERSEKKFEEKVLMALKHNKILSQNARNNILSKWKWDNSFNILQNIIEKQ